MDVYSFLELVSNYVMAWPFLIFIMAVSIFCTVALRGVQFRYFFKSWKYLFFPAPSGDVKKASVDMSPFQAFINTLNSNLGNGNLVGPAMAVCEGGPGALFWMVFIGIVLMAIRFAEVFLSIFYAQETQTTRRRPLGGPMLYLQYVFGGRFLSYVYAGFCMFYILIFANSFQAYSISSSLRTSWGVNPKITAILLVLFVIYLVVGNPQRIARASEKIVPLKVFVFILATFSVLFYHYGAFFGALKLILSQAFTTRAVTGAAIGFTVQQAVRFGVFRAIMALEGGVGTAAIMFGATGSKQPAKDAVMSMLSTFITTVICFISGLCLVVSGVWNSGLKGPALMIEAVRTVFGSYGCWAVSFLTVSFGLGVLVAVIYVAREVWLFLTGGRFLMTGMALYAVFAFGGALVEPGLIMKTGDLAVAVLLLINLYAILYLLPVVRRGITQFMAAEKKQ